MRKISKHDYYEIIKAGIEPNNDKLEGFSRFCHEQIHVSELLDTLRERSADRTDCNMWQITPRQWRAAIISALRVKAYDFELENGLLNSEQMPL